MLERYSAGDNIAAYCTKCKLTLDHTIVAMEGETIIKVQCKTCGGRHKFRSQADASKVQSPRVKQGDATKTAVNLWETSIAEAKGKEHVYKMTGKYRVGDIVNHDKFGKGVVMKLYMNKCDVLFQDRERLMASAN